MRRMHIFGDSHVQRMEAGMKTLAGQLADASLAIDLYSVRGLNWKTFQTTQRGNSFRFRAAPFPETPLDYTVDQPDDMYVFSAPLHTSPIYMQPAWREFCPWTVAKDHPELHAVSSGVIEGLADSFIKQSIEMLKQMKERGYFVVVAEAPKPLGQSPALMEIAPDVMAAVDQIYRRYASRKLSEIGVAIVPVPDFTHQDGLTTDEYSATIHHGNEKWGSEMLKQIVRMAAGVSLH